MATNPITRKSSDLVNLLDELSATTNALRRDSPKRRRNFYAECGIDKRCHCLKGIMNTEVQKEDDDVTDLTSTDSFSLLDARLRAQKVPLSVAERRMSKMQPIKLFKKKVDRIWHKRYNYVLPEDQQFDLQPYDEIQYRDEEIAVEYFYGDSPPSWLTDGSKESMDSRARILQRYNKEKRLEEEAQIEAFPEVVHTRVASIISVNRTRAANTAFVFGPSVVEKAKILPALNFMEKLVRARARERERLLHPLSKRSKWHCLRKSATLLEIIKMVEAERKIRARQKFRRTIKVVRAVIRFIRVISIMSRDARHVLTEIHYFQENQRLQTQLKIRDKTHGGVFASRDVFDPKKYRFSSRFKISNEIRMILTKPWNLRSDEEVNKVVERLQELRCFVEYPISFQHKLARLAWLIEVAADLAIIREGHIAADFYFMLAGKAKMIKLHGSPCLKDRGTFHTLRILKNGDAFGDESMSHPDSERTYSVITTEKSILLSLSSVDYVSMLQKTRDDEQAPEHIIFLSTLAFLTDFPKQKLIEEGDEYIKNYYLRSGSVISESLSESKYIYVVKYGSCRVLVEMPPAGSDPAKKRRSTTESIERRLSLPGSTEKLYMDKLKSNPAPRKRVSSVMEFIHNHREEISKIPTASALLSTMKKSQIDKDFQLTKAEADRFKHKSRKMFMSLRPETLSKSEDPALCSNSRMSVQMHLDEISDKEAPETVLSLTSSKVNSAGDIFAFNGDVASDESVDYKSNSISSKGNVEKHLSFIVSPNIVKKVKSGSCAKHAVGTNIDLDFDLTLPPSNPQQAAESLERTGGSAADQQSKPVTSGTKFKLPDLVSRKVSAIKHSRWKLMKTMVKGDYIGNEWIDLNTGPYNPPDEEMSLVSDGCEVIMMHREFLIKYLRKEL